MSDLSQEDVDRATNDFIVHLRMMDRNQRSEAFSKLWEHFCRYCGGDDPDCQCWNDE